MNQQPSRSERALLSFLKTQQIIATATTTVAGIKLATTLVSADRRLKLDILGVKESPRSRQYKKPMIHLDKVQIFVDGDMVFWGDCLDAAYDDFFRYYLERNAVAA